MPISDLEIHRTAGRTVEQRAALSYPTAQAWRAHRPIERRAQQLDFATFRTWV
jgi:hypothetical protein